MDNPLKNLFAVADLRNRILFTLALLGVYRVGAHITTPGVNREAIAQIADQAGNTMFGLYNMFTGGNLLNATIFALGVMPYISSSIILQLLTVVWPYLERISKEGELGRRKITQYTRYLTLALAVVQALGISFWLEQNTEVGGIPLVANPGWGFRLMCILTLTTGTMFMSPLRIARTYSSPVNRRSVQAPAAARTSSARSSGVRPRRAPVEYCARIARRTAATSPMSPSISGAPSTASRWPAERLSKMTVR